VDITETEIIFFGASDPTGTQHPAQIPVKPDSNNKLYKMQVHKLCSHAHAVCAVSGKLEGFLYYL
jgi:hypothetical protein